MGWIDRCEENNHHLFTEVVVPIYDKKIDHIIVMEIYSIDTAEPGHDTEK